MIEALAGHWDETVSLLDESDRRLVEEWVRRIEAAPADEQTVQEAASDIAALLAVRLVPGHPVWAAISAGTRLAPSPTDWSRLASALRVLPDITGTAAPTAAEVDADADAWLLAAPAYTEQEVRNHGGDPADEDLIRLWPEGGLVRLPAFQFDPAGLRIGVVVAINRPLNVDADPWGVAGWWLGRNAWLEGVPRNSSAMSTTNSSCSPPGPSSREIEQMPLASPPTTAKVSPRPMTLAAGTRLWRVHRKYRPCTDFKSVTSDPLFGGGRFDAVAGDPYPYLYAALATETALLETLVRAIPFDGRGHRSMRRAAIADCRISAFETARELSLIALLTAADLAAACQDEWLVQAEPSQCPQTRRWGRSLRSQAPWAQGLIWPSRRDPGQRTLVLFGDRRLDGALHPVAGAAVDPDDVNGAAWLNRRLAPYRIRVKPPRR